MAEIKCKADVQTSYHTGTRGMPMVNVKIYNYLYNGVDFSDPGEGDERFTPEWLNEHVTEEAQQRWWDIACEHGWEQAQSDADEIFDHSVKVYSAGRSGGWCVVDGLPDIESWDAIMLGKWRRFAKWARAGADDIAYQTLSLIYINVFEQWQDEQDEITKAAIAAAADEAAAQLPILAGV